VFWLRLNQRLHHLYPENETFVAEMEAQLVNEAPTHQLGGAGIRHFSVLNGVKENATAIGNCCEGQGAWTSTRPRSSPFLRVAAWR
jgi:hypothetical protein